MRVIDFYSLKQGFLKKIFFFFKYGMHITQPHEGAARFAAHGPVGPVGIAPGPAELQNPSPRRGKFPGQRRPLPRAVRVRVSSGSGPCCSCGRRQARARLGTARRVPHRLTVRTAMELPLMPETAARKSLWAAAGPRLGSAVRMSRLTACRLPPAVSCLPFRCPLHNYPPGWGACRVDKEGPRPRPRGDVCAAEVEAFRSGRRRSRVRGVRRDSGPSARISRTAH